MNSLLKQVIDFGRQIFSLTQRLQKAEEQIRELQTDLKLASDKIDALIAELQRQREYAVYQ